MVWVFPSHLRTTARKALYHITNLPLSASPRFKTVLSDQTPHPVPDWHPSLRSLLTALLSRPVLSVGSLDYSAEVRNGRDKRRYHTDARASIPSRAPFPCSLNSPLPEPSHFVLLSFLHSPLFLFSIVVCLAFPKLFPEF